MPCIPTFVFSALINLKYVVAFFNGNEITSRILSSQFHSKYSQFQYTTNVQ